MRGSWKIEVAVVVALVCAGAATVLFLSGVLRRKPVTVTGAVITQDDDTRKQLPIADAEIIAADGLLVGETKSDSSGFFKLTLPKGVRRGDPVSLKFRHADYQPLDFKEFVGDKLYIAHMVLIRRENRDQANHPAIIIGNVLVRYAAKDTTAVNIGSAVKTFEVVNKGNVPCNGHHPCSPDGKWKATIGSASLDAGVGNEFRNARASCIAGPCPFTQIESGGIAQNGRNIKVSARDWSDSSTFLVEAEVVHPMASNMVRESYPVVFGEALNFTLPVAAEGVSIQAEVNGETIIFPLGPNLVLSWADCNARVSNSQAKVYRCELKPGYRFR
jgi:hypothetical protein